MSKKLIRRALAAGLALAWGSTAAVPVDEIVAAASDQHSVAVTIYNGDLATVRDVRRVTLREGGNVLAWRGVSPQMRAGTAHLRSLAAPARLRLVEQDFDFGGLTPQTLLEAYVGREVTVIRTHPATGAETRETARVLSAEGGVVLQFADRVETGVPGRLAFPGVPEGLRAAPALVVSLSSATRGAADIELSYLTGGLTWRADYVAELGAAEDRIDLAGWATLTNQSGAAYPNARLHLVAGDLNRVHDTQPSRALMNMAKTADAPEMQQEALLDYHLYTLPRPTTLAQNQTKQIALMSAGAVPARKTYLLQGEPFYYTSQQGDLGQKLKVGVVVEFDNRGDGLGTPLPGGVIRVYKRDAAGHVQFVGEDRIAHTPQNETVRVRLGDAFDITGARRQTDFQVVASGPRTSNVVESAYEIVLKNAKAEAVTVQVREPMPGDWTVLSSSHPHTKAAAGWATWQVKVPAGGEARLSYRVRIKS